SLTATGRASARRWRPFAARLISRVRKLTGEGSIATADAKPWRRSAITVVVPMLAPTSTNAASLPSGASCAAARSTTVMSPRHPPPPPADEAAPANSGFAPRDKNPPLATLARDVRRGRATLVQNRPALRPPALRCVAWHGRRV